jgi:hypothetical protein
MSALLLALTVANIASAQPAGDSEKERRKAIEAMHRRANELVVITEIVGKDLDEIPFAKLLDGLNKALSGKGKFAIRLDRVAFGKEADKILQAKITIPPVPTRMTVHTALRLALAQVAPDGFDIEFTAAHGELVITTRERAFYSATYDIRDLLPHTEYLHHTIKETVSQQPKDYLPSAYADFDDKADPKKPAQWIVRQLLRDDDKRAGWHNRKRASTIEIRNGTTLVINTVPSVHESILGTLYSFRRLIDVAVVMEAKVYALDRADFDNHFASAFSDPKDKAKHRFVSTVTVQQHKRLKALTPIQTSDFVKLRPYARADFLTWQSAYQYQARPEAARPVAAFEGYAFAVRPIVSPDRRCMRLELFHEVHQLVKLTKGAMLDPKTGQEAPIELPNLRKTSVTEKIEIHDGQPILLVVDYRPKDKVWLVMAEPRIYIEEEEEQIRRGPPMPLADEKPPPPEPESPVDPEKPPVQLPNSKEIEQILQDIVSIVMTDPEIKHTRDFYGTAADKKYALDTDASILWPKGFRPAVAGYELAELNPTRCRSFERRLTGIRVDKFNWDGKAKVKKFAIEIVIHNVGGQVNGGVIGGCFVSFIAEKEGNRWKVGWTELFDP